MTKGEAKGFIQGKLDCMNKCDIFNKEDIISKNDCDNCEYCYSQGNFRQQKEAFQMAINELENVSDDVCEFRLLNGHKFLHETSCGDVFDVQNGFKYCPYCGKKIKVVD